MPTFLDRVKFNVSGTPGTGAVTPGSAVSKYRTPSGAGAVSGDILPITFEDGSDWEESYCLWNGTTLTRTLLRSSTGSLLSLTSAAVGAVTLFAQDAPLKGSSLVYIGQQVLGAAAATIDFSNIPADYEDLIISIQARGDAAAANVECRVRFNNDSGSNYYWEYFVSNSGGQTGAGGSGGASSYILAGFPPAASGPTAEAAAIQMEIPNYARTTFNKSFTHQEQHRISTATNGSNQTMNGGTWLSTAAINRITVYPSTGNFAAGTVVTLYARAKSNGAGSNDPTLYLIHDQILASDSATYDVTNIPQTYEDLVIVVDARQNGASAVQEWNIRPNNDTGANYTSYVENRFGTGSTTDKARFGCSEAGGATAGVYAPNEGTIFGYSKTNRYKNWLAKGFYPSQSFEDRNSGVWKSNSAITSLRFFPGANSFVAGTRIRVYGRKPSVAPASTSSNSGSAIEAAFTPPPSAASWIQQAFHVSNTHLVDFTTPINGVRIYEDIVAYGNSNLARYALRAIPSANWRVTARLRRHTKVTSYMVWGLVVRDSASGRSVIFGFGYEAGGLGGVRMTTDTAYNTYLSFGGNQLPYASDIWLRLEYNGTHGTFWYSRDGTYWTRATIYSSSALWGFLTNAATHVGFGYNANNAGDGNGVGQEVDVLSWVEEILP